MCENCGCKEYNGKCTNCDEELYILEQYLDQNMELPSDESEFMNKVIIKQNNLKNIN